MINKKRTDLALEEFEFARAATGDELGDIPGVESEERERSGYKVTKVRIVDEKGAEALGKPVGTYITIELTKLLSRSENAFEDAAYLLANELRPLLRPDEGGTSLVAGLGNMAVTPDAIGPKAVESIIVTRHLKEQLPEDFANFHSVAAIAPGVLGTTGLESAMVLRSVAATAEPARVIAVDALATANVSHLCRTVQISDVGIVPGSGVGNMRAELSQKSLGVPVIAVGVPTVTDARSLADGELLEGLFVTPRDIDSTVKDTAKLIAYGINLALHDGLSIEDIDMLTS